MKRPWIVFGVGVVAAMLVGRTLRYSSRSAPEEQAQHPSSLQSGTTDAQGRPQGHGWIARSEEGGAQSVGGARSKSEAWHGEGAPRGASRDTEQAASGAPGAMRRAGKGSLAAGSESASDAPIRVGAAEPSAQLTLDRGKGMAEADAPAGGRQDVAPQEQPGAGQGEAGGPPSDAVIYDSGENTRFDTASQAEVKDVGNISGEGGSISLWVRPQWDAPNQDDADLLALGDNKLHLFKNVNFLRFEFADQNGAEAGTGANIGDWKQGEWHQVAMAWGGPGPSGQPMALLFVDGKLVGQQPYNGALDLKSGMPMFIGSNYAGMRPVAPGVLSTVQVSTQGATPIDIATQFKLAQPPKD